MVVAEAATQTQAGRQPPVDGEGQRAARTDERPVGHDLSAVAQQSALDPRLEAVDATKLGLWLAGIA